MGTHSAEAVVVVVDGGPVDDDGSAAAAAAAAAGNSSLLLFFFLSFLLSSPSASLFLRFPTLIHTGQSVWCVYSRPVKVQPASSAV